MKFENTEVWGFEHAFRGMRNPMNSWNKSDSFYGCNNTINGEYKKCENCFEAVECNEFKKQYVLGEKDIELAQKLIKAGPEHRKFLRQIMVSVDITAPLYFIHEFDTYKIGTTRNSCSLQHKGAAEPFTIRDFEVDDERIYDVLDPIKIKKEHPIIYKYETEEYKEYYAGERKYLIYKNGKVFSEAFEYTDTKGRTRKFDRTEVQPSQDENGYLYLNLGGRRNRERWLLHRLVAEVWIEKKEPEKAEINHKDGNKGNNCVENLEWCTHSENEIHKHVNNLDGITIHTRYLKFKNAMKVSPHNRLKIKDEHKLGISQKDLAQKYNVSQSQVSVIINDMHTSDDFELFEMCWILERLIDSLNYYREKYNETKDYRYFRAMRQLLPQGYKYKFTWTGSYENLYSMIRQRRNHKLNEWSGKDNDNLPNFISWVKTLPYSKELLFYGLSGESNE